MARTHPTDRLTRRTPAMISSSPPALIHAAWITAAVAVCLALCAAHSRKSSSSSARRGSRSVSDDQGSSRTREAGSGAATPAKVSPTPADTAKAAAGVHDGLRAAAYGVVEQDGGAGKVTVIEVGTHGPIAPVFPAPGPLPPRRSLSAKHVRLAERLGRIRSRRWGGAAEEAAAPGGEPEEDGTLWTKTIILGERCRVPSADEDDGDGETARWKSYRPRRPRSVPVTRRNSFAGVDSSGSACRARLS